MEDTIKENIAIGGQEWDSPSRAEVSSSSAVQEGKLHVHCRLDVNLTKKKQKQKINALGVVLHEKVMNSRIRFPFYIYFLNPVYVAARLLRSLCSKYSSNVFVTRHQ